MKRNLILAFASLLTLGVNAQSLWNVNYSIGIPMGETEDFINKTSYRGLGIDGRQFVNNNITLGGSIYWNVFYSIEKNVTETEDNVTVHGNHYNYGNYMPLMFNAHFFFGDEGGIRPFVGTGIGTNWKEEQKNIGSIVAHYENNWQFALSPEVGVYIPVLSSSLLFVNARYNIGFETDKLSPTSYLSVGIGIAWETF